jgi:hypothetical protein
VNTLRLKTILHKISDAVNRIDLRPLIFILLFLNTFSLRLNENEEEYFVFAKAFFNPDWMPGAASIKDVPGTRIIFDSIIGRLLGHFTFEQVAVFGTMLIAFIFVFPFSRLFKRLNFTNLESIFFLQIFCVMTHQSFFAKEWVFGSFETKVISYFFVFYSLAYLLENRLFLSVLFSGLAVNFHILVGGWYSLILFLFLLLSKTNIKTMLRHYLVFLAITAPIGIYLIMTYFINNPDVINGININRIIVYFRNPHHLDMIGQLSKGESSALTGISLSFFSCLTCLYLYRKSSDTIIRKLTLFNILFFSQQFLSLLIALFDKNGVYLKFYPYRTSSLSLFIMLILFIYILKDSKNREMLHLGGHSRPAIAGATSGNGIIIFMILFVAAGLFFKLHCNFKESYECISPSPKESAELSLYGWIRQNTSREAVFLDLNKSMREGLGFIRQTNRDSFSVVKFIPTTNRLIYDWYQRLQEKNRVAGNIDYLPELRNKYRIDYILSESPLPQTNLHLVYQNKYFFLYDFKNHAA